MEEEEFPEFSYLLSLPAESVGNEKLDYPGLGLPGGRRTHGGNQTLSKPGAHAESYCMALPYAGTGIHVTTAEKLKHRETSCFSVTPQPRAKWQLELNLKLCMPPPSQSQPHRWWQHQRQRKQVQHENEGIQKPGQRGRRASQPSRVPQQQQHSKQQHPPSAQDSSDVTNQVHRSNLPANRPTAPAETVQIHRELGGDVGALQQRRKIAAAAASAVSRSRLEAYKQRRKLLAAKQEASRQVEIERSRVEFLQSLQKRQAELEEWHCQQQKEGIRVLRLQQKLDQQQAARKLQLKLLQAARAAAARKTLAAERAARAGAAEDSVRRRESVRRMEQARALTRANIATALHRTSNAQPPVQQMTIGRTREAADSSAGTALLHANKLCNSFNGKGEKPRLLSSSTARRVALRQQKYSISLLHRQMEGEVNRDLAGPDASGSKPIGAAVTLIASPCVRGEESSSLARVTQTTRCDADLRVPPSAAPFGAMVSFSAASRTRSEFASATYAPLSAGHTSARQAGEARCEADGSEGGERRGGAGTESCAKHTSAVTSDAAGTNSLVAEIEPSESSSVSAQAPLALGPTTHNRLEQWHSLAERVVHDTNQPAEEWGKAQTEQTSVQTFEERDVCACRTKPCCALSAVASTAATTPRDRAAPLSGAADALVFIGRSSTARLFLASKGTRTAERAPASGVSTPAVTSTRSFPPQSPAAPVSGVSLLLRCERLAHSFHSGRTSSQGVRCRSRGAVPAAQQHSTVLPALLSFERATSAESLAGWPETLSQPTDIPLPEASTNGRPAGGCAERHVRPTGPEDCFQAAHSNSSEPSHTRKSTSCEFAALDHNRGDTACCMREHGSIDRDARTSAPPKEQKGFPAYCAKGEVATHARWNVADITSKDKQGQIIDQGGETTTQFLEKVENIICTHVTAENLPDSKSTFSDDGCVALAAVKPDTLLTGVYNRKTGCSDGRCGVRISEGCAKEETSSVFQPPSISTISEDSVASLLETAAPSRSIPSTPKHATTWYSNSPTASPRIYRSYGTPNFGVQFTASLVPPSTSTALSARDWRRKGKDGVTADCEHAIDHNGCVTPINLRETEQPPPREQEQQPGEMLQGRGKNEHDVSQQESHDTPKERQLRTDYGARAGPETDRLKVCPLRLCGSGAASSVNSSRATHGSPADCLMDGFSHTDSDPEQARKTSDHEHHHETQVGFSGRVRAQQQCCQQPEEKLDLSLLQTQALFNQDLLLYSSSSSTDLSISNAECCCKAEHAGTPPLEGTQQPPRTPAGGAGDQSLIETYTYTEKPTTVVAGVRRVYVSKDSAPMEGTACSVRISTSPKSKGTRLRHLHQGALKGQYHPHGFTLRAEAAEWKTSDGAEADAESNCASAGETEDYPTTGESNISKSDVEHGQNPHISSLSETDAFCSTGRSHEASGRVLPRKTQSESTLLNASRPRVACAPGRRIQNAGDAGATGTLAGAVSATDDEGGLLNRAKSAYEGLLPHQSSVTVLSGTDNTSNKSPEVQASCVVSAGTAKPRASQKSEEVPYRKEAEGLTGKSRSASEQKQEGGKGDPKEDVGHEEHVQPLCHQSPARKEKREREQHPQHQENQLHTSFSEREFCCNSCLHQPTGPGSTHAASSTFFGETAWGRKLHTQIEITATPLVDEFLEIAE